MTPEERLAIQNLEWERSKSFLQEAYLVLQHELLLSAAHNIYYALFHAISALNIQLGLSAPATHRGLLNQFYLNYVKTGIFSNDDNRTCVKAEESRSKSDYDGTFKPTKEEIKTIYVAVSELIQKMINYSRELTCDKEDNDEITY